jgi:hypothetical protein
VTSDALDVINGREVSRSVYAAVLNVLDTLGPYEVETKKTSLDITRGRAFLGIHPRASGLLVNIVTSAPLAGERVTRTEQVSRNRYHNEVRLASPADVDSSVIGWARRAYEECA